METTTSYDTLASFSGFECCYCDRKFDNVKSARSHNLKTHAVHGNHQSFQFFTKVAAGRIVRNNTYYVKSKALKQKAEDTNDNESCKRSRTSYHTASHGNGSQSNTNTNHTHNIIPSSSNNLIITTESKSKVITDAAANKLKDTMIYTNEKVSLSDGTTFTKESITPKICIFCDRYIIGTDKESYITKELILKHSHRIDIDRWLSVSKSTELNPILRSQYLFDEPGFENLLLSPRSKKKNNSFMCCSTCHRSFCDEYLHSAPPKYSFANNFLIGHLPDNSWKDESDSCEMNLLLPLMIAPIRPFYYLFSVYGGACKRTKGTVSFFSNNQSQMHGALSAATSTINNLVFFLVFVGRLTHEQKLVTRNKIKVNMEQYTRLLKWMITNNKQNFKNVDIDNPSIPIIIDRNDDKTENLHDQSIDSSTENKFDVSFYFPSNDTPTQSSGGFESSDAFLQAVLTGNTPTMYLFGKNFVQDTRMKLEKVFPITFPFGVGGPDAERENNVSYVNCLEHYRNLCLPNMHRDDIILISHHLKNRIISYNYAMIKCNTKISADVSLAQQFSNITVDQLTQTHAVRNLHSSDLSPPTGTNTTSSRFFQTVEACCKPLQHTAEAAMSARGKYFAMMDMFSLGAIFVTMSPAGNRNLRVKAFALGKSVILPTPWTMSDEDCTDYLERIVEINQFYPGAGELEFRSQLDIFIENMLMWDRKKRMSKGVGICGVVQAFGISVEDQLLGNLHAHAIIFIEGLHLAKQNVFFDNLRNDTNMEKLLDYSKSIMSASYELGNPLCCTCDDSGSISLVSNQQLRDMRHEVLCKASNGFVGETSCCMKKTKTVDIVRMHLDNKRKQLPIDSLYSIDNITEASEQRLSVYALNYVSKNLKQEELVLLFDITRHLNNEHSWKHRGTCFKKGVECRFNYPASPCPSWHYDFGTAINDLDEDEQNPSQPNTPTKSWACLDGIQLCRSFNIIPNRNAYDLYLNIHNPDIALFNGFNNNVQLGDPAHIFYNTLYTSKNAVVEDTFKHKYTLEFVSRKIQKDLSSMIQASSPTAEQLDPVPLNDFRTGLGRLLVGITGHLHESVVSANLAAHIVATGTRFHFSHEFCHIMVRDFENYFAGDSVQVSMRWMREQRRGYVDSPVFDYVYRSDELEDISLYEFLSTFETIPKQNMTNENPGIFEFDNLHPSRQHRVLRKRKMMRIPIIESNNFSDLHILLSSESINNKEEREKYAKRALLLFHPFRKASDLYDISDEEHSTLWDKFMTLRTHTGSVFWKQGNNILQYHQDRVYNIQKLGRIPDEIARTTILSTASSHGNLFDENHSHDIMGGDSFLTSLDAIDMMSNLFLDGHQQSQGDDVNRGSTESRLNYMIPYEKESIILSDDGTNDNRPNRTQQRVGPNPFRIPHHQDNTIRLVIGSFIHPPQSQAALDDDHTLNPNNMYDVARIYNLDDKQSKAFFIQSSSFLFQMIDELHESEQLNNLPEIIQSINSSQSQNFPAQQINDYQSLINYLQTAFGAKKQLIQFLSGKGGSGKSFVLNAFKHFAKSISTACGLQFDDTVFRMTSMTGCSAAAMSGGHTTHQELKLNCKRVGEDVEWRHTKVVVIDEVSFLDTDTIPKCDDHIRKLTSRREVIFGGVMIIFAGDFSQLPPVANEGKALYMVETLQWLSLNSVIFLEKSHRFREDPDWGDLLERVRTFENLTEADVNRINERLISPTVQLCDGVNYCYACPQNKQRNNVSESLFEKYISLTHSKDENIPPPDNTIIILAETFDKTGDPHLDTVNNLVYQNCGDSNITQGKSRHIDPRLCLYKNCPVMLSNNDNLVSSGYANGSLCSFQGIVLHNDSHTFKVKYNGFYVNAVKATNVKYISLQKEGGSITEENENSCLKLHVKTDTVEIKPNGAVQNFKMKIKQFPILIAIAITGHKLQGLSKDNLVIYDWDYRTPHWIYVALSRVRTRNGLFVMTKLDKGKIKPPNKALLREEIRLRNLEN